MTDDDGNSIQKLALFLFNGRKLFVIREKEDKININKEAGMISVPIITLGDREGEEEGFLRLLEKEVGISWEEIEMRGFLPALGIIPGRGDIKITCALAIFQGEPKRKDFLPNDKRVSFVGWFTPGKLVCANNARIEVAPLVSFMHARNPCLFPL